MLSAGLVGTKQTAPNAFRQTANSFSGSSSCESSLFLIQILQDFSKLTSHIYRTHPFCFQKSAQENNCECDSHSHLFKIQMRVSFSNEMKKNASRGKPWRELKLTGLDSNFLCSITWNYIKLVELPSTVTLPFWKWIMGHYKIDSWNWTFFYLLLKYVR